MCRVALLIAVCAALLSCNATLGCTAGPAGTPETLSQTPGGNFMLLVSNQSRIIRSADIRVLIDGKVAVDDVFKAPRIRKGRIAGPPSNMSTFTFALAPGVHTLEAVSRKGKTEVKTQFTTVEKNWAIIDYCFSREEPNTGGRVERGFACHVSDKPIGLQ